jgi:hypothetical protein
MRIDSRLVGGLVVGLMVASYGCGDNSSPNPPTDAHDGAAADGATDGTGESRTDVKPGTGGSDGRIDGAAGGDGSVDVGADLGGTGKDGGGPDELGNSCSDGIKNGSETGIDCGGTCGQCGPGKPCLAGTDCQFGVCKADGTCGACGVAADCPGVESECQHRTCTVGVCGSSLELTGTVLAVQTTGDCKSRQCGADGKVATVNDDTDLPDDKNPCTNDLCTAGVPSHTTQPAKTSCGGANTCDAAGECVGCAVPADCPGTDTACRTRTCSAMGVCGFSLAAAGAKLADPTPLDCRGLQCDGMGNTQVVNDNSDLPVDGNPCTTDECSSGTTSHQPVAQGTSCGAGGLVCDGASACVACISASTCPGTDTECQSRTCVSGACGVGFKAAGTLLSSQIANDCKKAQCDGAGATQTVNDDTDLPVDNNPCTSDVCTAGVPSNPALAVGTTCGGTSICNGVGVCVGCVTANDCPGSDTECHARTCTAGVCGVSNTAAGTALIAQTAGDCKKVQCDGAGAVQTVNDDTDKPVDNNLCTGDVCTAGVPSNPPVASGSSCGPTLLCNATGSCVGCVTPSDCGTDTACQTRTCSPTGMCGVVNVATGTPVAAQVAGDCRQVQCDGNGQTTNAIFNTDLPVDGNDCTQDLCSSGMPSNPPQPAQFSCSQSGGSRCNGSANMPACVQCVQGADCPGADTECRIRSCSGAGTCGFSNVNEGGLTNTQTAGDCTKNVCQSGASAAVLDANDPQNDGNDCTTDTCSGIGATAHVSLAAGAACGVGGTLKCNGSPGAPACVECLSVSDCPAGKDAECYSSACSAAGACSLTFTPANTAVAAQTTGDCHENVCDGSGSIVSVEDDGDVTVDANVCTQDICLAGGVPSNPAVTPAGTTCTAPNGAKLCDATGTCVQCLVDTDCDLTHDTVCGQTHCAGGACTFVPISPDPLVADPTPGDCHSSYCDNGQLKTMVNTADLPTSTNSCIQGACAIDGTPSTGPVATGTTCSQNGGVRCDATATCVPTFMVVRLGDGSSTLLTSAATAVFIEERFESDGSLVPRALNPNPLPTAGTSPLPLTLSGTGDSEGALALSGDGHYVTVAGYSAPVGTASIGSSSATSTTPPPVQRAIARIDAAGNIDTSTTLGTIAFSGDNVRSAVTDNGTHFWAGGNSKSGGATRGVFYANALGATTSTLIESSTNSTRACEIAFGNLYCDAANGTVGLVQVGSGLPTTMATAVALNGTTTDSSGSYYAFVLLDLDGDGTPDTFYIADDRATALGGIQKWTLTLSAATPPVPTWTRVWTSNTAAGTTGARGLTGYASSSGVILIATTQTASPAPNAIIRILDTGVTPTTFTTLIPAVPGAVTVFRGVALAPK